MMSFHPVTMAKAAGKGPMMLLGNLPEEILAFEILVRLPPKALLHCHAVCRAWRRIASARNFLLAHHRRQPSLHLAQGYKHPHFVSHEILAIDHRAADAAQLQPVLQLCRDDICLIASCDGLLVLSIGRIFMCNPATRQFVGLNLHDLDVLALYLHRPTGEYRLLLGSIPDDQMDIDRDLCYVLTLGCECDQPQRCIGRPNAATESMCCTPLLVRGNLHWNLSYEQHQGRNEMMIIVFDTTSESFRQMQAPVVTNDAFLFEMDDMVGMYSCSDDSTIVDIWVMEDYEREVWSHMHHVKLPVAEIRGYLEGCRSRSRSWGVMVVYDAGDVLVLVHFGIRVLHVDIEGKSLSSSDYDGLSLIPNLVKLKQSLVRHVFFPRLQGAVNAWPFV